MGNYLYSEAVRGYFTENADIALKIIRLRNVTDIQSYLSWTLTQLIQVFWYILVKLTKKLKIRKLAVFMRYCQNKTGPGSSVGIATDYGLDGPGSNSGGDGIFRPSRPALWAHPASCKTSTGSFPGVKCGRGLLLTTHPLLVPRSWKSRVITLPTLWATPGL